MSKARDVKLKITQRFTDKADKENIKRAVITDALGNMSGAGSVWYDQNDRRVWHMVHGATNPAPIRCTRLPNPYIGLKVLIGKTEGVFEYEVLSDDPYDRPTNATGSNWTAALSTVDLSPGGRALLWLQTRALVPLAVWPGTGLSVNINAGDYQYAGAWVKYFGSTNYDLSASVPGAGLHRFIGIYLDSTGALQTVDGATAALALTPPDPVFPADVFRLAMVRLNDTQTVFSFANDIYDWRPIWSDPQGGGTGDVVGPAGAVNNDIAVYDGITGKLIKDGAATVASLNTATQTHAAANKPVPAIGDEIPLADSAAGWVLKTLTWDSVKSTLKVYFDTLYANWPLDKVITVSSTNASADYATLALALAGLPGAGYTILLDAETFTETVIITTSCTIIGLNRWLTKINGATNNKATIETQADVNFYNLTITNTGDGGGSWPLGAGKQNAIIINNDPPAGGDHFVNFLDCIVSVTTHNIDGSMAVGITGNAGTGLIRFINTDLTAVNTDAASTTDYGIYHDVGTLQIEGGTITGQDYDVYRSGGTVTLKAPTLQNSLIFGTYTGNWLNSSGNILPYWELPDLNVCEGRLTLTTATPITTADVTAATTVYFTPLGKGSSIRLYDGVSRWPIYTFTEKSIKLTDAQTGTTHNGTKVIDGLTDTSKLIAGMEITGTNVGAASVIVTVDSATQITGSVNSTGNGTNTITFKIPASKIVDVFAYNNLGMVKLEFCQWTNDTTRATALVMQDGVYCKTGALTRRYLGTVRTTTTAGETELSLTKIFVWNYYNQDLRVVQSYNSNVSWNLVGAVAIREYNAGTGQVRAEIVMGDSRFVYMAMNGYVSTAAAAVNLYIALDTVAVGIAQTASYLGYIIIGPAHAQTVVAPGYHYITQLELSSGNATVVGNGANNIYNLLLAQVWC